MPRPKLSEKEQTTTFAIRILKSTKRELDKISDTLASEHYRVSPSALARAIIERNLDNAEAIAKGQAPKLPDHPNNLKGMRSRHCAVCAKLFYCNSMRISCGDNCEDTLRRKQRGSYGPRIDAEMLKNMRDSADTKTR